MSLDFNRRHVAMAAVVLVAIVVAVVSGFSRPPSRVPRFGAPTEIVVRAEEVPPALATSPSSRTLRVCADPNNLPFSNARGEGFENKIAELAARGLGRQLQYYWQPQRRGFLRSTLRAGTCDVVIGTLAAPDGGMVLTTRPYYRSTYVFVSRQDRRLRVHSFDDARLKRWRIGIQLTGEDYGNPPPAEALASRNILQNIRGYTVYGDYSKPDPQRGIVDAVQDGSVDVAIVWGPIAGYFGHRTGAPVDIAAVAPLPAGQHLPLAFDISMAVRRGDDAMADALNKLISQKASDIRRILEDYHVPAVGKS